MKLSFQEFPSGSWQSYKQLAYYCARIQCFELSSPLAAAASTRRDFFTNHTECLFYFHTQNSRRCEVGFSSRDSLLVCTVGGIPLGTIAYTLEDDDVYIGVHGGVVLKNTFLVVNFVHSLKVE